MTKHLWSNLTQIGNNIILEFMNIHEAKIFYDIWTKDNHKNSVDSAETEIRLEENKVILVYRSTEDARMRAEVMIGPDMRSCEWHHPLESQGKRCKSCD